MSKKKPKLSAQPYPLQALQKLWEEELSYEKEIDEQMMADTFGRVVEVASRQTEAALELTKIITHHLSASIEDEQRVFSIFRQALQTIRETSSMRELTQLLETEREVS